ncbi:MAG TPA: type II toxin-antitoxin system HicA family toxin [Streptosporangiaceae bacterium]|nr:type II toxin-antitoxin system HicA family toxin [Streptosporangiaceae bacterium]
MNQRRYPAVSGKIVVKALENLGFRHVRTRGSHFIMRKDERVVAIPVHGNRPLPTGTLSSICRKAGIEPEDLR